jgi:hypothetical protein
MTEKRPMTDAEEELVEAAITYTKLHDYGNGLAPALREPLSRVREAAWLVKAEREPKLITPEERAVVEAAQRYIYKTCQSEFLALAEAVRRLPP